MLVPCLSLICVCVFWELLHSLLSSLNFKFVCCAVTSVINSSVFQSTGVPLREMSKNFFLFNQNTTRISSKLFFIEMAIKNSKLWRQSKSRMQYWTFKKEATVTLNTLNFLMEVCGIKLLSLFNHLYVRNKKAWWNAYYG